MSYHKLTGEKNQGLKSNATLNPKIFWEIYLNLIKIVQSLVGLVETKSEPKLIRYKRKQINIYK